MKTNKPSIIKRLTQRLGLEPGMVAPNIELIPLCVLNVDIGELMRDVVLPSLGTVDPGGAGLMTLYTVPLGKRARIYWVRVWRATGDATYNEFRIHNPIGTNAYASFPITVALDIAKEFVPSYPMKEGWLLQANVAVYTIGNTSYNVLVEEEDAY